MIDLLFLLYQDNLIRGGQVTEEGILQFDVNGWGLMDMMLQSML